MSRRSRGAGSVQVGRGYGMMAGMSIQARALTYKRQKEQSAAIRLLHADHAPVLLAVLAEHFPRGAEARPAEQLYQLMAEDFAVLRDMFELPRTPQAYCNEWVKAGWLVRKSGTKTTGETLEPSEQALTALQMMDSVSAPRSAVTASRVASISNALQALARDTDPDIDSRLRHLEAERRRIDAEMAQVERGELELPSPAAVRERVGDILGQASAIPGDFARVRHELEMLNSQLRRQLLDPDGSRGDVLDEIFAGVDLIGESDAGRSFNGFYSLVVDPERGAWLDTWIGQVLERADNTAREVRGQRGGCRGHGPQHPCGFCVVVWRPGAEACVLLSGCGVALPPGGRGRGRSPLRHRGARRGLRPRGPRVYPHRYGRV